ncbi:hypothetical protein BDV12DRAFT_190406 [Aspergillus spectabilis]
MNGNPNVIPLTRYEGFANVSRWVALDHDHETSIYRRFGELGAGNLLYIQCEMLVLEKELHELDKSGTDQKAQIRMDLIKQLRCKLKEHLAKTALDDPGDLVSLGKPPESDYLSILLRKHWPAKEELSRDGLYQIGRFNETSITVAVAIISILVASFLLIGSIVGLYFAKNNAVKLALVAAFTAVFAISVGLMTNARRAEIFAATAAYAAVLVVFISGDISKTQNTSEA